MRFFLSISEHRNHHTSQHLKHLLKKSWQRCNLYQLLDWTHSNLKLLPENFHLFDVLRAPLHLKIHHSAPCGICFMWKQSNQREQNVVWEYFLETCRQGSVFSCKCNRHDTAFISYMMKNPVPGRMVDVLTLHPRGGADWAGRPGNGFAQDRHSIWFTCTLKKSDWTTVIRDAIPEF